MLLYSALLLLLLPCPALLTSANTKNPQTGDWPSGSHNPSKPLSAVPSTKPTNQTPLSSLEPAHEPPSDKPFQSVNQRATRDTGSASEQQTIRVVVSDACVQKDSPGDSASGAQEQGKELDLEPGSPLVLTHRISLVPSPGACARGCEQQFAALRERLERLEREVSALREKCGGAEGGCCTSQQSTGAHCTIEPGDSCPNNCNDQGRCEGGKCVCFPGFTGPDCSTATCPSNCNNRGKCVNGQCVCDSGFTGSDCSEKSCPNNCNNKGRCLNGKCVCDSGFTGPDCSAKSCPNNCNNKGRCVNGQCVCNKGFTGPDCSAKSCPNNCNNKGRCVNGKCVCDSGFTGTDCSAKSCPNNCNNKGRCVNGECVCNKGFTGPDCSAKSCPNNCNNKGRCVNGKCVCDSGFTGTDCSAKSCPNNCNNKGRCVNGQCVCNKGFTGPDCSAKSCPNNCNNKGRCVNGECVCDSGFTGADCSEKSCPNNCNNKGRCVNGECVCDSGFMGADCSEKSCPNNCNNNGRCVNGECVCDSGFTGPDCSEKSCPNNCNDRGRCVNGKCVCDSGFTGPDCSTKSCPNNCSNRGRCVDGQCVCNAGFSGLDCATKSCPGNCTNRGRCVNGKCVCEAGFTGPDCSTKSCPSNCNNKGRCVKGKCVCRRGFTGPDCSQCEDGFTGSDCNIALSAVSQLSTRDITDSSVTLFWTPPSVQYETYLITFTSQKEGDQKITAKVGGDLTSYTQTGLAAGQEYAVSIRGEIDGKTGAESQTEFTTLISGPKNLHVVKTTTTSVVVQWEPPLADVDRYRLSVTLNQTEGGEAKGRQEITLPPGRDSAHIENLEAGHLYDITLVAERGRSQSLPITVQVTPEKSTSSDTREKGRDKDAETPTEALRPDRAMFYKRNEEDKKKQRKWTGQELGSDVPLNRTKVVRPVKSGGAKPQYKDKGPGSKPAEKPLAPRKIKTLGPIRFNATRVGQGGKRVGPNLQKPPVKRPAEGTKEKTRPKFKHPTIGNRTKVTPDRMNRIHSGTDHIEDRPPIKDQNQMAAGSPNQAHDGPKGSIGSGNSTEILINKTGMGQEVLEEVTSPGENTTHSNGKKCVKKVMVGHRRGNGHDSGPLKNMTTFTGISKSEKSEEGVTSENTTDADTGIGVKRDSYLHNGDVTLETPGLDTTEPSEGSANQVPQAGSPTKSPKHALIAHTQKAPDQSQSHHSQSLTLPPPPYPSPPSTREQTGGDSQLAITNNLEVDPDQDSEAFPVHPKRPSAHGPATKPDSERPRPGSPQTKEKDSPGPVSMETKTDTARGDSTSETETILERNRNSEEGRGNGVRETQTVVRGGSPPSSRHPKTPPFHRSHMGPFHNRTRPHLRPPSHPYPHWRHVPTRVTNRNGTPFGTHRIPPSSQGKQGGNRTGQTDTSTKMNPRRPMRTNGYNGKIGQRYPRPGRNGTSSPASPNRNVGSHERYSSKKIGADPGRKMHSPVDSNSQNNRIPGGAPKIGPSLSFVGVQNITSRGFVLIWEAPRGVYRNFIVTSRVHGPGDGTEIEEEEDDSKLNEEEEDKSEEERQIGVSPSQDKRTRGPSRSKSDVPRESTNSSMVNKDLGNIGKFSQVVPGSTRSLSFGNLYPQTPYSLSLLGTSPGTRSKIHRLVVTTGPEPPSNLLFGNVTESSFTVSWTKPKSPVTGFKVTYMHTQEGEPVSVSVDSQHSMVLLSQLSPGSSYEVSVISVKGLDESDPIKGLVVTVPDPPTDLRAINVTDSKALLLWRPALATVDRYIIVYGSEKGSDVKITVSGNAAEQQLKSLQGSTVYTVTVTSQLGDQQSRATTTIFTTAGGIDERKREGPRELTASNVTPRSAVLSWKPPPVAVTGYKLTYQTAGEEMKEVTLDPTVTQHKLTGLFPISKYTVRLQGERQGQFTAAISTEFTTGTLRFPFPSDCSQELLNGVQESGVAEIFPGGKQGKSVRVYCDMKTDGGGWTVFQRRMNGETNFFRKWRDYSNGFGNLTGEFWLGNELLHNLTNVVPTVLRVDLRSGAESAFAQYSSFSVDTQKRHYTLRVSGYSGTAGNSMEYHSGRPFSTRDRDPNPFITRCAMSYRGGWWYKNCHEANLNGLYAINTNHQGVIWTDWKGKDFSIPFTEMKLRPASFSPPRQG